MNYTDIDIRSHQYNSLYHFYNDNVKILSNNPKVNADDRIRLFPNLDVLLESKYATAPLSNEILTLTNLYDNTVISRTMDRIPANGIDDLNITKNIPEGWYNLSITGGGFLEDVYLSPFHFARKPFGLIELSVDPDDVLLLDEGELDQPTYKISFANRFTRWRYFDAANPNTQIATVEVLNPRWRPNQAPA